MRKQRRETADIFILKVLQLLDVFNVFIEVYIAREIDGVAALKRAHCALSLGWVVELKLN